MKLKVLDWIAVILVIIGALNWGLVGLLDFDVIASLFGAESGITRIVQSLVGLAGLYNIYFISKIRG